MATRIVITSPKGGDGRTTVALNLGFAMARANSSVLLVDLDPTSGLSAYLGGGRAPWVGLADHLMGRVELSGALKASNLATLRLLPVGRLDPCDAVHFQNALVTGDALEAVLGAVDDDCDVILVDAPAGANEITRAALGSASLTLPVVRADPLSQRALPRLLYFLERVQQEANQQLEILGMLPTVTDHQDRVVCAVVEALRIQYLKIQDVQVPRSAQFVEAAQRGQPIDPASGKAFAEFRVFEQLASTLQKRIDLRARQAAGEVVPHAGAMAANDPATMPAIDASAFLPFAPAPAALS